jgi:HK97 family phage portal protein
MKIWNRVRKFLAEDTFSLTQPAVYLNLNGGSSWAGEFVTPRRAQQVPTLLAGINLLANDISSLPLYLNVRTNKGVQMAISHPLFRILHDAWSEEITAREGLEFTVRSLICTGNFYNLLDTDGSGNISSITPLFASAVTPRRLTAQQMQKLPRETSNLVFDYDDPTGAGRKTYLNSQIWRGAIASPYGIIGESSLHHGRDSIGLALAADKASGKLFSQGSLNDGYFGADPGQDLNPGEWQKLVDAWSSGTDGAYKKLVLPPGVKFNPLTLINAQQSQFVERLQREDLNMARLLGIPASILDANEQGDTYAASESQRRWYVDHSLKPFLVLLQQSINLRCLSEDERNKYFAEFNTDALLDADLASRYEGYSKALASGWMTRNEVRRAEGLNPLPGLDVPLVQSNNMGTVNPDGSISPAQRESFTETVTTPPAKQAQIEKIIRASAERIARKEAKSGKFDAEFVAEVLCVPAAQATAYCADRTAGKITTEQAVEYLVQLAIGELDEAETVAQ